MQEYLGSYVTDEMGRLVFKEGALVQAVRRGHWIVLDELNLAPSEVLEALNRWTFRCSLFSLQSESLLSKCLIWPLAKCWNTCQICMTPADLCQMMQRNVAAWLCADLALRGALSPPCADKGGVPHGYRLLDDNRELFVPELRETVKPHPHFMLFATQNPPGVCATWSPAPCPQCDCPQRELRRPAQGISRACCNCLHSM